MSPIDKIKVGIWLAIITIKVLCLWRYLRTRISKQIPQQPLEEPKMKINPLAVQEVVAIGKMVLGSGVIADAHKANIAGALLAALEAAFEAYEGDQTPAAPAA
jgi:hypothetical protein